jgi:hypothetical protein
LELLSLSNTSEDPFANDPGEIARVKKAKADRTRSLAAERKRERSDLALKKA